MASTHSLNKKPYRRVLPDDWLAIEAMYRAGATAKALAYRYDIGERTIYGQACRARGGRRPLGIGLVWGLAANAIAKSLRAKFRRLQSPPAVNRQHGQSDGYRAVVSAMTAPRPPSFQGLAGK